MEVIILNQAATTNIPLAFSGNTQELTQVERLLTRHVCPFFKEETRVVATLTIRQLMAVASGWSQVFKEGQAVLDQAIAQATVWWTGPNFQFDVTLEPLIYAIINCTPDSFFDGQPDLTLKDILQRVETGLAQGVKVFELGGKSSRPGFADISAAEEWARLAPAIKGIQQHFPEAVLAVDTNTHEVMQRSLAAGVPIINDIDGFQFNDTSRLIEEYRPSVVTMHNNRYYEKMTNVEEELYARFTRDIAQLTACGLEKSQICIDPGVGFSYEVDPHEDIARMQSMPRLAQLNVPMMIAISRKSFLGKLFNIELEDRLFGTLLFESLMAQAGGRIIRVHDVAETKLLLDMLKVFNTR